MDLKEFGNSINKILNERLSSPFYGSLIVSWLIINWKIIYLTLFVDSKEIVGNKIDFIIDNYSDQWYLIWFPLISTILLICVVPFITYGAYWLSLFFNDLRQKRKIEVEKSQVLTVEQSLQIRAEIQNQKITFNGLLDEKNDEISLLKKEIEILNSKKSNGNKDFVDVYNEAKTDFSFLDQIDNKQIDNAIYALQNGRAMINLDVNTETTAILEAYDIIKPSGKTGIYSFGEKGKEFLKYYYKNK
ncbi:hypothetical protein GCM10011344_29880 [Dokdonia pacifica]|uniref:Uncharacterized protein n=1 Tax=Dokdonia pacifica TaxID=1627892 RepID=A0A239C037_9FLAO|nr:hypothetical protein [Dokdonia pacifica]GGG27144.1 hypothetical protein GCM10011344_29880 [Dokdonia pacifica]SNS13607.1 hypothetical protein SAMN06265376_10754 [Dokdonia pacifica]